MKAGWSDFTLKDICVVDWGNTNLTKSSYSDGGQFLAVSAAGCDGRIGHSEHRKHTPVLSAIGAQCGKMFFPEEDFTAIKNTITLTPREALCDGRFLYYLLTFVELPQRGAGQPFISKGDIQKFRVSIPPLEKQRRIVAVLDEAFAAIATATANAQKNLANARALFACTIEQILEGAPGCRTMTLLAAADESCSLSYGIVQPGDDQAGGLPIVRPTDLQQKYIELGPLKRIAPDLAAGYQRTKLRGDELLLCVRGTTGTLSIAAPELAGGNVTRGIVPIRFNPAVLSQKLGYYLLLSEAVQKQIKAATYGTALMQINIRDLKQLELRVPKLASQDALADRLDTAQRHTEGLQANYSAKLDALAALKQSLLHRAFTGELTAAMPETIAA
ncbi:restriction endonuclease subunit S [Sphingomonas flavalba]|uniref:restriction endonuclease subunit S n=1 Tax=Sphingomonas flavalba TaxID=2559804 RepID=UPI0039DF2D8F